MYPNHPAAVPMQMVPSNPPTRTFRLFNPTVSTIFKHSGDYVMDAKLVVEGIKLDVHRHFLSMLSPVFRTSFDGAPNAELEILVYKRKTVENILSFCYGDEIVVSLPAIINMLRFAETYNIAFVKQALQGYLPNNLSFQNYRIIAKYAWDMNVPAIKNACIQFYALYHDILKLTYNYMTLNPEIRADIEQRAAAISQHQYNGPQQPAFMFPGAPGLLAQAQHNWAYYPY